MLNNGILIGGGVWFEEWWGLRIELLVRWGFGIGIVKFILF